MVNSRFLLKTLLLVLLLASLTGSYYAADQAEESRAQEQEISYFSSLHDNYFLLEGVPRIENNIVDVYKIPGGLSFFRDNAYFHPEFSQYTAETIDFELLQISLTTYFSRNIPLYYPVEMSFDRYFEKLFQAQFRKEVTGKIQQTFVEEIREIERGLIPQLVIDLPPLPGAVRKFIGDRPTRLSLTGTQRLTLSGSSTKRDDRRLTEGGRTGDLNLEMRQDLNLRLRGTIGDKISVNVRHSSQSDLAFMDPSTIEIEYQGDEDEIIQSIKGGNISLSLTGSEFIRYSASSSGLFGVRTDLKLGDLEITAIASKEEAQKLTRRFTGTDAADSLHYQSRNYAPRTHYYVVNPYELFVLYTEADADTLPGYVNNAIRTDRSGAWMLQPGSHNLLPDPQHPFTVYYDEGVGAVTGDIIDGWEIGEDPDIDAPYDFEILEVNTDYFINYETGILSFSRGIDRRASIGVSYTTIDGRRIGGSDAQGRLFVKPIRRYNQSKEVDPDTWPLKMRNIYNLNRRNIQNDGFRLNFFTINPDGTLNYYIDEDTVPGGIEFNEYLRLDTNGDGQINGYDETVNLTTGFVILPMIEPFRIFPDNVIYDRSVTAGSELITIYMSVVGKIGRDRIELGQMNILERSVRVIVDGETLQENVHYLVDYDFGHISFLTEKGRDPDSNIEINYEYRPLFAAASKTLMGLRADWRFSDITRLGGTFIYHSEKVGERRPGIGNENRTLLMADIDGRLEFDPPLFTKLVDMIPLIRTDADSRFRLSGEVAMTLPRMYGHKDQPDRKEAYVDDMEGNVDSYPLGLTRLNWSPASKPYGTRLMNARPNWYNPDNIYNDQVYDPEFLTERERKEKVQVLTLRTIPPQVSNPHITNQYWGGIMRYLGNELDFSDKKYIELLVKVDEYPFQTGPPSATIHIDLGDISENFYVWNGGKGVLNTEDGANGGMRDGILEPREDVGLDGIPEGEPGDDPYDNFSIEQNEFGDYPWINGTSGNGILDTEDLNGNGALDTLNRYFQYSVNLQSSHYESEHKGWRLYRIPMDQFVIKSETGRRPDLRTINFARVWMETDELTRIQIARMHIVGNRWQEGHIKDQQDMVVSQSELDNNNEFLAVSVVDNQNNRDHYVSPPNVEVIDDGVPLLEQALAVDYNNLQPNHYGLVTRRFRENQNLLSYGKVRYWVYLERGRGSDIPTPKGDQEIVFRVGADSLNYYEVRYPAEAVSYNADGSYMNQGYWRDIEIDFSQLTSLKQNVFSYDDSYETKVQATVSGEPDSVIVAIMGNRVTLTNIREISVGVANRSSVNSNWTGRLYANDIRVAEPYEDIGFAARTTLNTTFADFSTLNVGLVWRSQNFNTNVSRTARVTNEESVTFDITNRYNMHKFFPPGWGFNIPLTLNRSQTTGIPRYKANSDILREDIEDEDEREREKRENLTKSVDISFNQTTNPRNKFLLYTVRNTTLRGNVRHTQNLSSTSADTTFAYSGTVNYNLTLPRDLLSFGLGRNYRFNFLPHSFNNTATYRAEEPNRWRWNTNLPDTVLVKWTRDRYSVDRKELNLGTTINYDFISSLKSTYTFNQKRDMMQDEKIFDAVPFGREVERDQNLSTNFTPTFIPKLWEINATASARYRDVQKPFRQTHDSEIDYWEFDGNVARNTRVNLRLKNRDLLNSFLSRHGVRVRKLPDTGSLPDTQPETHFDDGIRDFDEGIAEPPSTPHDFNGGFEDDFDFEARHEQEMERLRRMEEEAERAVQPPETKPEPAEKTEEAERTKEEQVLWARLVTYFARLENLNITYENNYGTRYSRFEERPDFLYQLGVPHRIENEKENLDMKENRDNFTVASGYPLLENLTTTWNYSRTIDRRYSTASQKEITTVFPNVRVNLSGFEKLVRADKFMTSSRLSSNYTYTERVRGAIDWDKAHWDKPTARNKTHSFSPLLSWQANWLYRLSSTISYNHSQTTAITYRETYQAVQESINNSVTSNISWSFRSPQGLKIPFIATRIPVTNEMTTDLGINWERSKSINEGSQETVIERDTEKYRINPRLTYNFSRNIRGGLQSSYENNHDRRRDERLRIFSLSAWAEITF